MYRLYLSRVRVTVSVNLTSGNKTRMFYVYSTCNYEGACRFGVILIVSTFFAIDLQHGKEYNPYFNLKYLATKRVYGNETWEGVQHSSAPYCTTKWVIWQCYHKCYHKFRVQSLTVVPDWYKTIIFKIIYTLNWSKIIWISDSQGNFFSSSVLTTPKVNPMVIPALGELWRRETGRRRNSWLRSAHQRQIYSRRSQIHNRWGKHTIYCIDQ